MRKGSPAAALRPESLLALLGDAGGRLAAAWTVRSAARVLPATPLGCRVARAAREPASVGGKAPLPRLKKLVR